MIYLMKLIRTNKFLSLSIETLMHVACFVKTLIVILFKKKLIRTNNLLSLSTETYMHVACFF